ncbi:MAG: tetraacyldisaccharide 4'-kinase [Alphaproteobacteria bacterium]
MQAPDFWTTGAGPWPYLLAPAGWLYGTVGAIERALTRPYKTDVRVICVGNLTAGGSGKTPVAIALARMLTGEGAKPGFITRGYGGTASGPIEVDPSRMRAAAIGDEALLLARTGPTRDAKKRKTAINSLMAAGVDHIILDDGFQDPALVKDVSLVVVDGETGFGNGRCIPAGPLREPIETGLARADAVVVMGPDRAHVTDQVASLAPDLAVFTARLVPSAASSRLRGRRVFAFAGIGRPEKFRATLVEIGADIQGFKPFADHHLYKDDEVSLLMGEAMAADAMAVTTAKDWVRLKSAFRDQVEVVEVEALVEDERALMALISGGRYPSGQPAEPGRDA